MAAPVMTIEQCSIWLARLPGEFKRKGWLPEINKIGGYLVREHKKILRAHTAPDFSAGTPWPKTYAPKLPKRGEEAPMLQESTNSFHSYTQAVRSRKGQIAAIIHAKTQDGRTTGPWPKIGDYVPMRILKNERRFVRGIIRTKDDKNAARAYRLIYGPPLKSQPALIRDKTGPGSKKALKIWNFLTSFEDAFKALKDGMLYGFERWPTGMRWIRELHFGGASSKYKTSIPARPVVGWTPKMVDFAAKTIGEGTEKRLRKL
jgi:hypothetical protein